MAPNEAAPTNIGHLPAEAGRAGELTEIDYTEPLNRLLDYRHTTMVQIAANIGRRLGEPLRSDELAAAEATAQGFGSQMPLMLEAYRLFATCPKKEVVQQLLDPATGGWLAYVGSRIENGEADSNPEVVQHARYLHLVAASAAIRSGRNFGFTVPVWRGRVTLPGLGQATLQEDMSGNGEGSMALVQAQGNIVTVSDANTTVTIPRDRAIEDAPGWTAFKTVTVALPDGSTMSATLDHLNPFRRHGRITHDDRLTPAEERGWLEHIRSGMELYAEPAHIELARRIAGIMRTVVPLQKESHLKPHRPISASAGSTIGSAEMNWQVEGPHAVAATFAHEFAGHNRLNLIMARTPLLEEATQFNEQFWSPPRDDVRHPFGLVHAIESFLQVTNFWRDRIRVEKAGSPLARVAQFEVAHWRKQLHAATEQLMQWPELLTEAGQDFLNRSITPNISALMAEKFSDDALQMADLTVTYNRARWIAHHFAPEQPVINKLVNAWFCGAAAPHGLSKEPLLQPDPAARNLNTLMHMASLSITSPDKIQAAPNRWYSIDSSILTFDGFRPNHVPGSIRIDTALLTGETELARQLCLKVLSSPHTYDDTRAIVGLGFTINDKAAGQFLHQQPHVFRAVQRAIVGHTGRPANPVELAQWLSEGAAATEESFFGTGAQQSRTAAAILSALLTK